MTEYQAQLLVDASIWFFVLGLISVVYYINSKSTTMFGKLSESGHGITFALAFLFAIVVRPYTENNNYEVEFFIFYGLIGFAILLVLYSFVFFRGKKIIHLLQIPNVLIGLVFLIYGTLLIGHDSL